MNTITGFTFFRNYHEALKELPKRDKAEVLNGMIEFVFEDKEPNFTGIKQMAWLLIKPSLTKSKNKSKNAKKENKAKSKQNQIEIKLKSKTYQIEITHLLYSLYKNNILNTYILVKGGYRGKKPLKKYGSFKNVLLSDEEHLKLKNKFLNYEQRIEDLSFYIKSSGKKYKSHYATILNWSRKEDNSNKPDWYGEHIEVEQASSEEMKALEDKLSENKRF